MSTTRAEHVPLNDPSLFVGRLEGVKRVGWSADEFLAAFDEDAPWMEILDGELTVAASPFRRHNFVLTNLFAELRTLVRQTALGMVHTETDVVFDDETVLRPDIVLLPQNAPGFLDLNSHIRDLPLLVVEVLSPSTRTHDCSVKLEAYERFGVPHYWIVDPEKRRVDCYTLARGSYQLLQQADAFVQAPPFEGARIELNEVFDL